MLSRLLLFNQRKIMANLFCQQLKTLRKAANLTQSQFAEKLNMHLQTVSKWERGVSCPDISLIGDIADMLNVSVGFLIVQTDEKASKGTFGAQKLGKNISVLRHSQHLEQRALAKQLCVSTDTVSKWERAVSCPDLDSLIAIAQFFNVSISDLYFGVAAPQAVVTTTIKSTFNKKHLYWLTPLACIVVVAIVLACVFGTQPSRPVVPVETPSMPGSIAQQPSQQAPSETPSVTPGENQQPSQDDPPQPPAEQPVCEHVFAEWLQATPPSCTKPGQEIRSCTLCGESETRPVSAVGHTYTEQTVAPTCTQNGYLLHTCSACGTSYKDNFTQASHQNEVLLAVQPDCTHSGLTEGLRCSVCRQVFVSQQVIAPLGHNLQGLSCSRCNFALTPTDSDLFDFELLPNGTYKICAKSSVTLPEEVVIPETYNGVAVTVIGRFAIPNTQNVKSVFIPICIKTIEVEAMVGNKYLQAVYYGGTLEQWLSVDIGAFNFKVGHSLYLAGVLLEHLVFPSNATVAYSNHFNHCTSLKSIVFSDSVTEVEEYAFEYCINVTSVYIPYSVLTVGPYVFLDMFGAIIYCEAPQKPDTWHYNWDGSTGTVIWDCLNYVEE